MEGETWVEQEEEETLEVGEVEMKDLVEELDGVMALDRNRIPKEEFMEEEGGVVEIIWEVMSKNLTEEEEVGDIQGEGTQGVVMDRGDNQVTWDQVDPWPWEG